MQLGETIWSTKEHVDKQLVLSVSHVSNMHAQYKISDSIIDSEKTKRECELQSISMGIVQHEGDSTAVHSADGK